MYARNTVNMYAWAIQNSIRAFDTIEAPHELDALPPHVLLHKSAWEKVIIDNPRAILLVQDSFWGIPGQPSPQGIAVAHALYEQGSDFTACLPLHIQELLYHRDMMAHPSFPQIIQCPPAPMKRRQAHTDPDCKRACLNF